MKNKQQFILDELAQISKDMMKLVESEQQAWAKDAIRREEIEQANEARRKREKAGERLVPAAPLYFVGVPQDLNHLKHELDYFLARLTSVREYLFGHDVADAAQFVTELARKLTS